MGTVLTDSSAMQTFLLPLGCLLLHSAQAQINGQTLTVTSVEHEPWLRLKTDKRLRVGNDRYEGFVMDLLGHLENKTGASFPVSLQSDGQYGRMDEDGGWTGMIGSVMAGDVDIAVADITQTALRETAVDFTVPFDQVGITILYPVSFGYVYPKMAFQAKPFGSLSELVNQNDIKFGMLQGGATYNFFKTQGLNDPVMAEAFLRMNEDNTLLATNKEGIEKVISSAGKFAFFLESAGAEYATAQNCGLTTVGGKINTRNYGIVTKRDSVYRKVLNIALLELMEEGVVKRLKQKWWGAGDRNCNNMVIQKLSDWIF